MKKIMMSVICAILVIMSSAPLGYPSESVQPVMKTARAQNQPNLARIHPSLLRLLRDKKDSDVVTVAIWFYADDARIEKDIIKKYPSAMLLGARPSRETPPEVFQRIDKEMKEAKIREYERVQQPVKQLLQGKGHKIGYSSNAAPLLFTDIPKNLILELSGRVDVDRIYPSLTFKPAMDGVAQTIRAYPVWDDYDGYGVRIAVIEPRQYGTDPAAGSMIDFSHNDIPNADLIINDYNNNYYNPDDNLLGAHATNTAGIIVSQNPVYKGVAPGAKPLLSGNAENNTDLRIIAAADWAIGYGRNTRGDFLPTGQEAKIINNSYISEDEHGPLNVIDRYFDHISYHYRVTVVAAAGNREANQGTNVGSPGLSYNSITVGAYDDWDTAYWSDDVMLATSRSTELAGTDREKPEVVAVGASYGDVYNIITTALNNNYEGNGRTSMATAQVSGLAALIMQADPYLNILRAWPEAVKAIIMASAIHNIDGQLEAVSERDGAGGIDAQEALVVTRGPDPNNPAPQWTSYYLGEAEYKQGYWDFDFPATIGQRVRLGISWPTHASYTFPILIPEATTC